MVLLSRLGLGEWEEMIIANSIEIPDECPKSCSGKLDSFDQGSLCTRCPVFCCTPVMFDGENLCLIAPEDYRLDWAIEWKKWFDNGTLGLPDLRIR